MMTYKPESQNFKSKDGSTGTVGSMNPTLIVNGKNTKTDYYVYLYTEAIAKKVSYTINHLYKNGTKSGQQVSNPIKHTVVFKSNDNGKSWKYSLDNSDDFKSWNNADSIPVSLNLPTGTKLAHNYNADLSQIITNGPNDKSIFINSKDNTDNTVNLSIDLSKVNQNGTDTYEITIPYYTTEYADVRFVDDDEHKNYDQEKGILDHLKANNIDLTIRTSDNLGYGLSTNYTKNDDKSKDQQILFNNLDKIMSALYKDGYIFKKVDGSAIDAHNTSIEITNNNGKTFNFGNFDNNENKDQHFVIHLGHRTDYQTQHATVTENVKYYYENGKYSTNSKQPSNVPETDYNIPETRSVSYSRTGKVDAVTGNVISWTPWKADNNGKFDNINFAEKLNGKDGSKDIYTINRAGIKANGNKGILRNGDTGLTVNTDELSDKASFAYNIFVPYKLHENIHVHYIDEDNKNQEIAESKYSGDPIKNTQNNTLNTIKDLIDEGYILDEKATLGNTSHHNGKKYNMFFNSDNNKYNSDELTFDNDEDPNNQNYYVYLYHNIQHDLEEKTITENIKYIDEVTGQEIHDQYHSGTLTFTRNIYTDKVTGAKQISNWSLVEFKPVENPTIPGYTIDPDKIAQKLNNNASSLAKTDAKEIGSINFEGLSQDQITALPTGSHIDFVVPYVKNVTPPTPEPTQPIPSQPTSPTKPTPTPSNPTQPTQASQPTSPAKPKTPKTPKNSHHKTRTPKKPNTKKHTTSTFNPRSQRENHHKTTNTVPSKGQNISVPTKNQHIPTPKSETMKNNVKNTNSNIPTLPQTGEKQNKALTLGLGILALSALLGLAGYRKRKDN